MSRKIKEIRHSGPVEEIMGNPPASMVRWGTTIFALLLLMILVASWFIRYPYIVTGQAEITTSNPPANLNARVSGKIEILNIDEGDRVAKGEVLAIMESTASYESVMWLSNILDTVVVKEGGLLLTSSSSLTLPDKPDLGELQEYYSAFRKSCIDYYNHVSIDMYGKKIAAMQEEIGNIDRYMNRLLTSEKLFSERFELETKKYLRDSVLYIQEVYSLTVFEKSRQDWLQSGIDLEKIRLDRASRAIEKSSKLQEIQDLLARGEEERERFRSVTETDYLNLTARIDWWFQNYLLVSPIDGRVTFNKFWGTNQVVTEGETVLTVVPEGEMEILARVKLSVKGSGKVKKGQQVNIKLNGYPYLEYGMVQGIVSSKSLAATTDGYIVDVELPENLTTFYGNELEFSQNMPGIAEIVTDDMRLLERVIYPFKFLVEKNRR